jgi:hypothetical protein
MMTERRLTNCHQAAELQHPKGLVFEQPEYLQPQRIGESLVQLREMLRRRYLLVVD